MEDRLALHISVANSNRELSSLISTHNSIAGFYLIIYSKTGGGVSRPEKRRPEFSGPLRGG